MRLAKGPFPNRVVDHLDHLFLSNRPSRLKLFLRTMLASRMSYQLSRLLLLRNKPSLPNAMKTCLLFSLPLPLGFRLCNQIHPLLPDCLGCFCFFCCFDAIVLPCLLMKYLIAVSLGCCSFSFLLVCYCFSMMPKGGRRTYLLTIYESQPDLDLRGSLSAFISLFCQYGHLVCHHQKGGIC